MKTYILILYFQMDIELLLSSSMELITMNDHILNMLKADLIIYNFLWNPGCRKNKPGSINWYKNSQTEIFSILHIIS